MTAESVLREAERLYRAGQAAAALALCERTLAMGPTDIRLLALAGALAGECGNPGLAAERLAAADRLRPGQAHILFNLGVALQRAGDEAGAVEAFTKAIASRPDHVEAWFGLAQVEQRTGNAAAALAAYRRVAQLQPGHPGASHMAAALAGDNPATAPSGYARALFDDYAARFDSELVGRLGYRAPEELRAAILAVAPHRRFSRTLDLGCGTGLAGAALNDLTEMLYGVDASPAMLVRAVARGIYTGLEAGDLAARLRRAGDAGERFDLIVAADVLVYFGALEDVLTGVAACLDERGLFAFSVERLATGSYRLLPSGRYAHADGYLRALAADVGLTVASHHEVSLRRDGGQPVAGAIYILGAAPLAARQ